MSQSNTKIFLDTPSSALCWTIGANTMVSYQNQEPINIWIFVCWYFLSVGIFLGSWWTYNE